MVPPSVLLAEGYKENRLLATLFIRTARSRRGTCWSQLTGGGQFLRSVSLSPDGALFDEAEENTEIIGGGDQSDCGGLLTRPRPDPEELRSQRGGGVSGPVQRVPPAPTRTSTARQRNRRRAREIKS